LRSEPGTAFYVIASGNVKIHPHLARQLKERIARPLGTSDFEHKLVLLDDQPASADSVATEHSASCSLYSGTPSDSSSTSIPKSRPKLLATLSACLRGSAKLIQDAAFLDVCARVLLELAGGTDGMRRCTASGTVIPGRLKQPELGSLVGATRESVNKWLGSFERQGLISYEKGQITLLKASELKQRIY